MIAEALYINQNLQSIVSLDEARVQHFVEVAWKETGPGAVLRWHRWSSAKPKADAGRYSSNFHPNVPRSPKVGPMWATLGRHLADSFEFVRIPTNSCPSGAKLCTTSENMQRIRPASAEFGQHSAEIRAESDRACGSADQMWPESHPSPQDAPH